MHDWLKEHRKRKNMYVHWQLICIGSGDLGDCMQNACLIRW